MTLVLDGGALIAVDRRDRAAGALLRVAQQEGIPVRTSAAVVAQVWRNGTLQANLARVLTGVDARPLDGPAARSIGRLLAKSKTLDVADGHLALIVRADDTVLSSDPGHIKKLLSAREVRATVRRV